MNNSLTKGERLCGRSIITELFTSKNTLFCYPFRCVWSAYNPEDSEVSQKNNANVSVLFSVAKKKIKKANKRNLLKRRMRESYRLNKHPLVEFTDASNKRFNLALIYIATDVIDYPKIEHAIKTLIFEVEKANK